MRAPEPRGAQVYILSSPPAAAVRSVAESIGGRIVRSGVNVPSVARSHRASRRLDAPDDEVALCRRRRAFQQIGARRRGAVGARAERHLLPDDHASGPGNVRTNSKWLRFAEGGKPDAPSCMKPKPRTCGPTGVVSPSLNGGRCSNMPTF